MDGFFTFTWTFSAETVYITGTFNDWKNNVKMERDMDGVFRKTLMLPRVHTRLKFVVDGNWVTNPNMEVVTDESGNLDNVLFPKDFLSRWEMIRRNAAERAKNPARARSMGSNDKARTVPGSDDPGDSSGEESIESRVKRIKARVLELTASGPDENGQERVGLVDIPVLQSETTTRIHDGSEPPVGQARLDSWDPASDQRLARILSKIGNENAGHALRDHGISDLWLPVPKQTLQKFIPDKSQREAFLRAQNDELERYIGVWSRHGTSATRIIGHAAIEDDEDIIVQHKVLGEGAYGTVEEVSVDAGSGAIRLVRKQLGRPKPLNAQKRVMTAFAREINIMRQVDHQHCVKFLGSYTHIDHVNILSSPVADMDLATFLDRPIGTEQRAVLCRGIGCLCNAINYLHENNIRHEDLKPQNVLHGDNILLTDFGFSLDFSDDSISTTTGRPSAWTLRYSAPEVLNFEPRNRATDIFSLGCVLVEMISGFYGQSLTNVKDFWKRTGNGNTSFARNPEAVGAWSSWLREHECDTPKIERLCTYVPLMLTTDRFHRPTTQQIMDRLSDLSILLPEAPSQAVTGCTGIAPCVGLSTANRASGAASSITILEYSNLIPLMDEYIYPWEQNDWRFEFFDLNMNASHTEGELWQNPVHHNWDHVRNVCEATYTMACRTGATRHFWQAHEHNNVRDFNEQFREHAELSAKLVSVKHIAFTRLTLQGGNDLSGRRWRHERIVQITLLPVCLAKSPYFGSFFWMISHPLRTMYTGPARLPPVRDFVDLTVID
tara:strand:+ start:3588 stop:5924 length:2337 start_codon:yes stop_codon:yes gene_type:complete